MRLIRRTFWHRRRRTNEINPFWANSSGSFWEDFTVAIQYSTTASACYTVEHREIVPFHGSKPVYDPGPLNERPLFPERPK